jgi:hypothetical protein
MRFLIFFLSDLNGLSKIKVNKSDLLAYLSSSSSLSSSGLNQSKLMSDKNKTFTDSQSQTSKFKRLNDRLHRLFPSLPIYELFIDSKLFFSFFII